MSIVREYISFFLFSAVALLALISFTFVGASLMTGLSSLTTYLIFLGAASALAVALGLPLSLGNKSGKAFSKA